MPKLPTDWIGDYRKYLNWKKSRQVYLESRRRSQAPQRNGRLFRRAASRRGLKLQTVLLKAQPRQLNLSQCGIIKRVEENLFKVKKDQHKQHSLMGQHKIFH